MKFGLLIAALFLILLVTCPSIGHADNLGSHVTRSEELTNLTDNIMQYTGANQINAAKSLLSSFNKEWEQSRGAYSETDWRTVDTESLQLKLQLNADADSHAMNEAALSLRLCVDALTGGGAPLWKDMQEQVLAPVETMKKAIENQDQLTFQSQLNNFLDQYAVIYPSLVIDGPGDQVQLVDRTVAMLENNRLAAVKKTDRISQLNLINAELAQLFDPKSIGEKNNFVPAVTVIGGCLFLTLIYVSWRKYSGRRFTYMKGFH